MDLNGHSVDLDALPDQVVVLVFVASDCPISNRYLPELARVSQAFAGSSVRLWLAFPNPAENATGVRAHLAAYHLSLSALLDPEQTLVAAGGVRMTPEAAVFLRTDNGQHREVYRGRIDNRYISFGHEKPTATQHELEDAIRAAREGKPVLPAGGRPVGCAIVPLHTRPMVK